jgi:hypothetical protein
MIPLSQLTGVEKARILAATDDSLAQPFPFASLEEFFVSREGMGVETATPVQRAICRAIEGIPIGDLRDKSHVLDAFGGKIPHSVGKPPADVIIVAAARGGKSMIAAATAIYVTQKVDLTQLSAGEIPRFVIVSLSKDNAKVIMQHIVGALQKPACSHMRVDAKQFDAKWKEILNDSGTDFSGSEFVRHPSGRPVEIRVVAGKRAGGSAISRWLAGMVLDEAPRMLGQDDSVINYDDMHDAALSRVLPGGITLSIGSPWQPYGPIYEAVNKFWGHPTPGCVVVKAKGPWMYPAWWTPEKCEDVRVKNPTVYQTDVLAEFADVAETMYPQSVIVACTRHEPLTIPREAGHSYAAKIDPATRRNAWTIVVADRVRRVVAGHVVAVYRIVYFQQWKGTPQLPLSPREVFGEIDVILAGYGIRNCLTDQWSADALVDIAAEYGLFLDRQEWSEKEKTQAYLNLETAMKDGKVEIPPDPVIQSDLRLTRKIPTQHGVSIRLTETKDGRHCDYAPAIAGVLTEWIEEDQPLAPKPSEPGFDDYEDNLLVERDIKKYIHAENDWMSGGCHDGGAVDW